MMGTRQFSGLGVIPAAYSSSQPYPNPPPGDRLPTAPRQRKPALAALAVLLILGGALVSTTLVIRAGGRMSAIALTRQVEPGQPIPLDALREVSAAQEGLDAVPWNTRHQLLGSYAAVTLLPGTLLTPAMVRSSRLLDADQAVVGLSLHSGQLPPELRMGDFVEVYRVNREGSSGQDESDSVSLAGSARVFAISSSDGRGEMSGGGPVPVSIVVNHADAPRVAQAASSGNAALVQLAPLARTEHNARQG